LALAARVDAGATGEAPADVVAFLDQCDAMLEVWAASHDYEDLARALTQADAVHQRVYAVDDIVHDPHYQAREDLVAVPDTTFGEILMHGVVPKFPRRAHTVTHAGRERGADNVEVYGELLELEEDDLKELSDDGII
jgi:formyl-CoA transferase